MAFHAADLAGSGRRRGSTEEFHGSRPVERGATLTGRQVREGDPTLLTGGPPGAAT
jgi:hypothetical protein